MRKTLCFLAINLLCVAGVTADELAPSRIITVPTVAVAHSRAQAGGFGKLTNHGGPVMPFAKITYIFWGSSWHASDPMVTELQSFRSSFSGMVSHMGMLTQYGAQQTSLQGSQADVFDSTNPSSAAVTDAMVQAEVKKWFAGAYDFNTIYEVFIPNGYYSQNGSDTSCGGPSVKYCAYHSNFVDSGTGRNVKYSIEPYPSCSGCSGPGWTTTQNAEHFAVHESRESMTDALGTAWYDLIGYEADDKCAWGTQLSPTAFLFLEQAADGHTYGYQMEYSNAASGCVK